MSTIRVGQPLSRREDQVLRSLSRGNSNKEIGRELSVSASTVKVYVDHLRRKLGARDRTHAVSLGYEAGILRVGS